LLALIALGIAAAVLLVARGFDQQAAMMMRNHADWAALIIVCLMILHCFIPFPAELVALAAGAAFGLIWGVILVWIGAMIGASLSFWLARRLGRPYVERILPEASIKVQRWGKGNLTLTLLVSRFIPVIAFNLINYAAGLTSAGWGTFLWTTAVGILPITILTVLMGETMQDQSWHVVATVCAAATGVAVLAHYLRRT
jgi:uncharacterized membrane protein YdjX (TVP38/TMEM64 family)